jgi:predicted DNA-binding transcriptional regulator YafY
MASTGRRSGAYAQTARVFQLLELLLGRRRPTPLDALAEDLGVSPRQVRRDLEALAEGGHPTETIALHDRRVGVVLLDPKPRSVSLSNRERYALLAARGVFDVLSGTTLREDLEAVCRKVAVASP